MRDLLVGLPRQAALDAPAHRVRVQREVGRHGVRLGRRHLLHDPVKVPAVLLLVKRPDLCMGEGESEGGGGRSDTCAHFFGGAVCVREA